MMPSQRDIYARCVNLGSGRNMGGLNMADWALDELQIKRKEWNILFELCLKHKQWALLEEYWEQTKEIYP